MSSYAKVLVHRSPSPQSSPAGRGGQAARVVPFVPALAAAHAALDKAVDKCYRNTPFASDRARVEYLFQLYEQLTAPLAASAKPKRSGKGIRTNRLPPGKGTPQSEADAAHHYSAQEESPPYRAK